MRLCSHSSHQKCWRSAFCWFYQTSLSAYPKNFRNQFGLEMRAVFEEALDGKIQEGWFSSLLFLGREVIETPVSALNQHLVNLAAWARNYLHILFAYTLGFLLLGLIDLLYETRIQNETQGDLVNLLAILLTGGLCGLTAGIIMAPHRKLLFTLAGAVCLLIAIVFPGLGGWIILIVLSLLIRNWRGLLHVAGFGALALFIGYFVNRLAAALMQSFFYHSPTQNLNETGACMALIPFLITGLFMGIYFSGIASKRTLVKA